MITKRQGIIVALIIPILFLAGFLFKSHYAWLVGERVTLSVHGFDPRDLISGNYISYRIDYKVPSMCGPHQVDLTRPPQAFVCLKPKIFSYERPLSSSCDLYIKGYCRYGRFHAGIEHFYLPEKDIKKIDKLIRYHKVKIIVSITKSGSAVVTQLLLEDTPWKTFLESTESSL